MKNKIIITLTIISLASMITFSGCQKQEVENIEGLTDEVSDEKQSDTNNIQTAYVSEEYQNEINKLNEEQKELDKEREEASIDFTEDVKMELWSYIYKTSSWNNFSHSEYFSNDIDWYFYDALDHIVISGNRGDNYIEIIYGYYKTVDIQIYNSAMQEVASYPDPRQLQTFDFTAQKDFEKMRMIITGKNFLDITEIKVINDKTQKEYLPDDNEYHEIDEAVFVIENVSKGDKFTCNMLTTENVTDIRTCAVEYNESAMVNSKR